MDGLFAERSDRWTQEHGAQWWDRFYSDRSRPVPFFSPKPDENLVAIVQAGLVPAGRALDLGSGPGGNAIHLAREGFEVVAVDLSPEAIRWRQDRAAEAGVDVMFVGGDAFDAHTVTGTYDFVYDSGCFHHLPPHRRVSYLALLERVLRPGGVLGLTCFARGQMGSELPDAQLYRDGEFEAGVAYSADDLRWIFERYDLIECRPQRAQDDASPWFGETFLLSALFRSP
ncbi:MAG: class I SAM-dependent methyltransferase [Actinomycetota bacterium]|nr:class I SAM-dependent methyltransferase [Actinomycetota bacterium]